MGKLQKVQMKHKAAGGLVLDRMLVPRIEQYALNNAYTDADEVAEYLRRAYKEYQRRQLGPFRTMVARAIAVVQRKGGPQKPELQLQVWQVPVMALPMPVRLVVDTWLVALGRKVMMAATHRRPPSAGGSGKALLFSASLLCGSCCAAAAANPCGKIAPCVPAMVPAFAVHRGAALEQQSQAVCWQQL